MSSALAVLIFLLILIIIILSVTTNSEHFDTYWNHTFGAQDIYQTAKDPQERAASKSKEATELLARYTWSEKAPSGMQVYDKYYEHDLLENASDLSVDPTYYERDTTTNILDSRFQTLGYDLRHDTNAGYLAQYNKQSMDDPSPLATFYNGEQITLSQKRY